MQRLAIGNGGRAGAGGSLAPAACVATIMLVAGLLAPAAAVAVSSASPAVPDGQEMARQLALHHPPGSLASRALADSALAEGRAVHAQLQREFEAQRRHCADVFFVNHCMDEARHAQRNGERVVHAVTLEAHDLQRHLDAAAHVQSREETQRQQAADDQLRPERERQAALSARTREQNATAREADEKRDLARAAQDSVANEARARAHQADVDRQDALRPQLESASRKDFQEKQASAVAYARTRAEDRAANARRRDERKKERDAAAAADHKAPVSGGASTGLAPK